jgi:hypothetical protein
MLPRIAAILAIVGAVTGCTTKEALNIGLNGLPEATRTTKSITMPSDGPMSFGQGLRLDARQGVVYCDNPTGGPCVTLPESDRPSLGTVAGNGTEVEFYLRGRRFVSDLAGLEVNGAGTEDLRSAVLKATFRFQGAISIFADASG